MKRALLIGILALTPIVAEAQQAAPSQRGFLQRGFLHISGAWQSGSEDVTDAFPLALYDEVSQSEADYRFDRGSGIFEIGGGFPVWRQLSIGVSYTHMGSSAPVAVHAAVPHPVVFDRPRLAEVTSDGLERSENVVHFRAIWTYPVHPKIDLGFFLGPSIFNVSQDLIAGVTPGVEVAPFNQIELTDVSFQKGSGTTAGVNIGVEATYHLRGNSPYTRGLGFQTFFKYAGGTADIELNEDVVESEVGGPQFGFGIRYSF